MSRYTPPSGNNLPSGSYVPTWIGTTTNPALGNGKIWGRYAQLSKNLYQVSLGLEIGSTTALGAGLWLFGLPPALQVADLFGDGNGVCAGACYCYDSSAATFSQVTALLNTHSATSPDKLVLASGASFVGPTVPFAWAVGDLVSFQGLAISL